MHKFIFLILLVGCAPYETSSSQNTEVTVQSFDSQILVYKSNGKIKSINIHFPSNKIIYNIDDLIALETQVKSIQEDLGYIKQQMFIEEDFKEKVKSEKK